MLSAAWKSSTKMTSRITVIVFLLLLKIGFLTNAQGVPGLTAHFPNETALNVSWNAPSDNEKVASYEVIILEGNTELKNITVDNSTRSVIIPSLDYCKTYTVKAVGTVRNGSVITTPAPGEYATYQYITPCAPPVIAPATQKIYVHHGNPVNLTCNYSGFPTPSLYWRVNGPGANKNVRQGTPVILLDPNDPETSILQTLTVKNGNLHISSVEDLDKQRNYTCVVQNRLGTASGDVSLILVGVYETVKVKIKVEWTPELQTHYQNNDSTSFLSQQFKSEVANFSSKLQDTRVFLTRTVLRVGVDISMELDFTATTTEGDPSDEIVNGILNMKDSGYFGVLPIKSVTILGLPPPPPTNLKLDDIQAKEATVTWQPPHHAEVYEVSEFTVQMKKVLGGTAGYVTEMTVGADVTKAPLINLEPDTEYLVRVRAHRKNDGGLGESKPLEMLTLKGAW